MVRRRDPQLHRHAAMTAPEKALVSRAFGGATDYDRYATVQRRIARDLAQRIAALDLPAAPRILEIGCGTGFLCQALGELGVTGTWHLTDIAPQMLARARQRLGDRIKYAVLDGENGTPDGLPYDLICASLATQWFADEPAALARWPAWLAPGGHIMVATLGAGTFAEWRAAHAMLGVEAGTPRFTPPSAFAALGLAEPAIVEHHREHHDSAPAFLRALRGIGATTADPDHHPLSAGALRRVMRQFEKAGAVASYEVVTCHLTRASTPI